MTSGTPINEVAVAVMHLDEFMLSLPRCFTRKYDGRIYHDPDDANLFLDERELFVNSHEKIHKIESVQEFATLKHRLLTVPTYLSVTLSQDDVDLDKNTGTWHHFMVCINPNHPIIREELEENLNKCTELVESGKHFCFYFRLGPSLRRWYEVVTELPYYSSRSFNCTICVTNFMEECYMCYSPVLWTTLFPIMLLVCGPYIIYRMIACKELSFRVRACIMLVIGDRGCDSKEVEHLCVVKHQRNPLVSTSTQVPSLYDIYCRETNAQARTKRHVIFRPM